MPGTPTPIQIFVSHSHQDDVACQKMVSALREAGADVWYDEHNLDSGRLMDVIERELRKRPAFLVMLSPASIASVWVKDECSWAYRLARRDPTRLILPVLVEPMDESDIWLWMQDYKRIEAPGVQPFPSNERIRRTLRALALTPKGQVPTPETPQPVDSIDDLLRLGKALDSQKRYAEALPFFQRATEVDPNNPIAWYNLASTLSNLQRHAEALPAVERVTALIPNISIAWSSKGGTLNQLKRYEEGLAACEKSIELDPNYVGAWINKGAALLYLKRYTEALVACDKALALDPNSDTAWNHRGVALHVLRRYSEALIAREHAIALNPDNDRAWIGKASDLRALGQEAEAQEAERRAQELGGRVSPKTFTAAPHSA